ncbi:MAG: DUF1735 domain-containing protein [Bacteroidales bacterium]|nr:DUF1735 domain-containing protein [Bacteroidales bacterium]
MKRISIMLAAALILCASCRKNTEDSHVFDNVAYLNVSQTRAVQSASFGKVLPSVDYELHAALAYPEDRDVNLTIEVDPSAVSAYNSRYGASLTMLDTKYFDFTGGEFTIPAGKITSDVATLHLKNLMGNGEQQEGSLPLDQDYLVPVRITASDIDLLETSSVAYYVVKRSSNITVAAQLGTGNWINFPTLDKYSDNSLVFNNLTAVTYEALIYIDDFLTTITPEDGAPQFVNISTIMGKEQYLLLRIGDTEFERKQIQFDGSGTSVGFGKMPKRDDKKNLEAGRWYHIAATYDYATLKARVYVDGRLQSESNGKELKEGSVINLADRAYYDFYVNLPEDRKPQYQEYAGLNEAYQFFIGRSYNEYRPLCGKIAEARVWSVARTQEEIYDNIYEIADPESHPELIGYWKFDDGKGNVVKDYSRYHNDGVSEIDLTWPSGIEIQKIYDQE